MPKTFLTLFVGSILLIVIQACAPSIPATSDPGVINTAVAQTLAAVQTQTSEPGIPVTGDESATPSATAIVAASPTSTALLLPSPVRTSTVTAAPSVAQVTVSVPTNCRVGPGTVYPRVGALLVGEVAEVVGRHADRDYWVIRNPDRPGELCWLWGEYATLTGNTGVIPEVTPPPTPTPSATPIPSPAFDASYSGLESCTGTGWWADVELENTGGITFRSFFMIVTDTATGTNLSLYGENFIDRDGCNVREDQGDLDPRDTLILSSPSFNYDPSGHRIQARITVCSEASQNGICATKTITFTP